MRFVDATPPSNCHWMSSSILRPFLRPFGRPQHPTAGTVQREAALPLSDTVFAVVAKVYEGFSFGRFTYDLKDARANGFVYCAAHFNSVDRYPVDPQHTEALKSLVTLSSRLKTIEIGFAVDSSSFGTLRFVRWFKGIRQGGRQPGVGQGQSDVRFQDAGGDRPWHKRLGGKQRRVSRPTGPKNYRAL
jgi:hypothetical protein